MSGDVWNGVCCFLREEVLYMRMEKEMFRDMGSKIDVFLEYREWENEHMMSNGVLCCMEYCSKCVWDCIREMEK